MPRRLSLEKPPESKSLAAVEAQDSPELVEHSARAIKESFHFLKSNEPEMVNVQSMGEESDHYPNDDSVIAEIGAGQSRFTVFQGADGLYGMKAVKNAYLAPDGRDSYRFIDGTAFDIGTGDELMVGRESEEFKSDKTLSRKHFTLRLNTDGKLEITDVGSRNGTMLRSKLKQEATSQEKLIKKTEEAMDELVANLTKEDAYNLWKHVSSEMNKSQAQGDGHGDDSIYYGQEAGQAYNLLSDEARNKAPQYRKLMTLLEKQREATS